MSGDDTGRRYGIDQVMATINAETIPDLIDHASRRLRQALAVLMQGHRDEIAELHAENAMLTEALNGLRPLHETPYADEEHQGGNCADFVMALLGRAFDAERRASVAEAALRKVRDWCDQCEEEWLGAVPEVRDLLPVELLRGAAGGYADDRSSEPKAQTTEPGAQVSPVQTPDRADASVAEKPQSISELYDKWAARLGEHYAEQGVDDSTAHWCDGCIGVVLMLSDMALLLPPEQVAS